MADLKKILNITEIPLCSPPDNSLLLPFTRVNHKLI